MSLNSARAHLVALAQDMRASGLDYHAEHLDWVLRSLLPMPDPSAEASDLDIGNSTSPDLAETPPGTHNR